MLKYWYSDRCSRHFKFLLCALTVVCIYASSGHAKLDQTLSLVALLSGMCVHLLHEFKLKFLAPTNQSSTLGALLPYLPILVIIGLITLLPSSHRLALSIQLFGFTGLGFYLVSIYNYRTKRSD